MEQEGELEVIPTLCDKCEFLWWRLEQKPTTKGLGQRTKKWILFLLIKTRHTFGEYSLQMVWELGEWRLQS